MATELKGKEIFKSFIEAFDTEMSARRTVGKWLKDTGLKFDIKDSAMQVTEPGFLSYRVIKTEEGHSPIILVGLHSTFKDNDRILVESQNDQNPSSTFTSVRLGSPDDDHIRMVVCKPYGIMHDISFPQKGSLHGENNTSLTMLADGTSTGSRDTSVLMNIVFVGLRVSDGVHDDPVGSLSVHVPLAQ